MREKVFLLDPLGIMNIHKRRSQTNRHSRRAAATVEMAICLPMLITLVFGTLETANMIHVRQSCVTAAYEAGRERAKFSGTEAAAETRAADVLAGRAIDDFTIEFDDLNDGSLVRGDMFRVTVGVSSSERSVGPTWIYDGVTIEAAVVMVKE